jgi:hypothetical protein
MELQKVKNLVPADLRVRDRVRSINITGQEERLPLAILMELKWILFSTDLL